jgi:2'-5' RNA ligase
MNEQQLFFIALLPPQEVSKIATEIKQHFANVYQSKASLKSPPHITLQPPFKWNLQDLEILKAKLREFSQIQAPIPMILDGFSAFKPRVIYINVLKTKELLTLHHDLILYLEHTLNLVDNKEKSRAFSPHLTVGFKDLTKTNFYRAWSEFKDKKLHFEFIVPDLTLLIHNGKKWEIEEKFSFEIQEKEI